MSDSHRAAIPKRASFLPDGTPFLVSGKTFRVGDLVLHSDSFVRAIREMGGNSKCRYGDVAFGIVLGPALSYSDCVRVFDADGIADHHFDHLTVVTKAVLVATDGPRGTT